MQYFFMQGMISEIEAINDYSYSLYFTENKEIKDVLYHIMKEDKEHVEELTRLLNLIDKDSYSSANCSTSPSE